ncbi:MAG TPA: DUF2283 domain-containing protein [Gaiellaceae bacterium]|nr:DUF2283 domain-containing protein [Gaiellaceae bacterium]
MDSHSPHPAIASAVVKIAGIEFDRVVYDRDADVLYLHVGEPSSAVDFAATPEGHHTRYGPDGSLVGITIVDARWLLEEDGEIVLTLPEQKVRAPDLGTLLTAA